MDLENGLLNAVVEDPGLHARLLSLEITPQDFTNAETRKVFEFISKHAEDHKSIPGRGLISELCGVNLADQGAEQSFLVTEFLKRKIFRRVNKGIADTKSKLEKNDPLGAFEVLQVLVDSTITVTKDVKPRSLFPLGFKALEIYEKVSEGYTGVPFPWPSMTNATLGMWPKTVTYFTARPNIGKSWVVWLLARHAWLKGYRVLVISPEMSAEEGAERFFIIDTKVPGKDVLHGQLSDFLFGRFKGRMTELKDAQGIWIIDSEDDLSAAGIESAIRSTEPQLIVCDAMYMLELGGRDRSENTIRAVSFFRRMAKRYGSKFDSTIAAFHMLSRAAVKSSKSGGVGYVDSAIALTDQLFWDAHGVWIMEQDKDMRDDNLMKIHCRKVRRGTFPSKPVEMHWNYDRMEFGEIDADPEFEDEEYQADDEIPF